jgi:HPt (histidine-containing phosphotransfer) domain-containing protein
MTSRAPGTPGESAEPLVSDFAADAEMADLLQFFFAELHERIGAMTEALEMGDMDRLRSHVNQLKGAAGGYGFPSITESAASVENALRRKPAEIRQSLDELIALCQRAIRP